MLGFSLLRNSFQFVEIKYQEGKPVVERFANRKTPVPFDLANAIQEENLLQFQTLIQEAVEVFQLNGAISVALDSRMAFVKKFLVDLAMQEQEIEEQVNWEFRQIIPESSLSEYQYVYERLPGGFYQNLDAVISVAYRKKVLEIIETLFQPSGLQVALVDLDIFSALYAVNRLYGTREYDLCVLADVREDQTKIQFVRKGEYFDLHIARYSELEEGGDVPVFESAETVAKLLNKEIRRKLMEFYSEDKEKPVDVLFVFGDRAGSELVDYLAMSPARDIVLVEPFRKLELNLTDSELQQDEMLSSRYTVGVGAALRTIF